MCFFSVSTVLYQDSHYTVNHTRSMMIDLQWESYMKSPITPWYKSASWGYVPFSDTPIWVSVIQYSDVHHVPTLNEQRETERGRERESIYIEREMYIYICFHHLGILPYDSHIAFYSYGNDPFVNEKWWITYEQLWFSIATFNNQRVPSPQLTHFKFSSTYWNLRL